MKTIIVGCEESQTITKALRALGYRAFSCDLLPCSGGHPEWHYQMDIFDCIDIIAPDMGIFHPPCTFVAGSAVQWLSHPEDKHLPFEQRRPNPRYPNRRKDMWDSVEFVKKLYDSLPIVAIENPVGKLSTLWQEPDQIVQPYFFGDEATKTTCFWLKGLPKLVPTKMVGKGERTVFSSGKSFPKWYADAKNKNLTKEERQTLRSVTFPGMAQAIAEQWGPCVNSPV